MMVNFLFVNDPNKHVMELQFMHEKMLLQRKGLGGHGWYACYRTLSELAEFGKRRHGEERCVQATRAADPMACPNSLSSTGSSMAEEVDPNTQERSSIRDAVKKDGPVAAVIGSPSVSKFDSPTLLTTSDVVVDLAMPRPGVLSPAQFKQAQPSSGR